MMLTSDKNWRKELILFIVCTLLAIGLFMVYSASAWLALHDLKDAFFYVKRQALFALIGLILMTIVSRIHYSFWEKVNRPFLFGCYVLLILVLIPGIGLTRGGATSWLGVGTFSLQPSEFMKLAMIIFLAHYLTQNKKKLKNLMRGFLPPLFILGSAFALIMLQPDLGTGTVLMGTGLLMIFVAGARWIHFVSIMGIGLVGFIILVAIAPYRMARITAFIDPWQDPLGAGYQLIQSLYAIGPGGLLGLGWGESRQKYYYVPEPQTDFIFSILSEELGFVGSAIVLLLFLTLFWQGMRIAVSTNNRFPSLLAFGIVAMIAIQVIINIGVVTGLFPVTGITLPLISYGGSSLTLTLMAIGIVLNVSRDSL